MKNKISRREFLRGFGLTVAGAALASCAPEVIKETVTVEKEVEKTVIETVEVEVAVEKVVEVTPVPLTGPTNALGVTLPADALPLEEQYRIIPMQRVGEQMGGAFGHEMESLYNRAYPLGMGSEVLTRLDEEGNVVGIGCESWKQADDLLSWDFFLRPELAFSDGTPITAEDWVWTLQRSFGNAYDFGWFYGDILNASKVLAGEMAPEELGVEAVDDYTLRIKTATPVPYVPALGVWIYVAPKQAYEQFGDNWSLEPENYIASGPWKLSEFERGVKYSFTLNEAYMGVSRPYYTELRGRTVSDTLAAYVAGETQAFSLGINSPAGEVGIVNANPVLRSESHPQPSGVTWYIGFNTLGDFPELTDIRVRTALNKAVDKERIIGEIGRGFANPAWGILPKGFPGNRFEDLMKEDPNVFDPEAAKALLADAGFPDGAGFPEYELWIRSPQPWMTTICEAVQASWKEHLGVNVKLVPADHPTFTANVFAEKKIPIYHVGYSLDFYDPATFLSVFRTGGRHPWSNEQFDETYANANAEVDPKVRLDGIAEAEKILVNDAGFVFLSQPFTIKLWPCNLAGEVTEPNSLGYSSDAGSPYSGGGVPWVGGYWTDSTCRDSL